MSSFFSQGFLRLATAVLLLGFFSIIIRAYLKIPTACLSSQQKIGMPAPVVKRVTSKKEQNLTVILIWMWPFGRAFTLSSCSERFNIDGCHLTADRKMLTRADGVIMHHRDIHLDLSNMPPLQHTSFQKWAWMNFESPSNSRKISGLRGLFNLTVNYRQDADISIPYGAVFQAKGDNFNIPNKTKLVCWIASNYKLGHKRVQYYIALKQHVNIAVYGRAFGKSLSGQDFLPTIASCKFYLSFENSIHKDYITEKLYNPLAVGTVPIVLGPSRQNYENFAPGDAFIHVDDFPSPRELAEHILSLDKNEDMYTRYFYWRKHLKAERTPLFMTAICHTCDYLKKHKQYKAIKDLDTWYWGR